MCLISKVEEPSVSSYNIICYKILIPIGSNLVTPYRDFVFPINKIIDDQVEEKITEMFGHLLIESGYFHSYKSLEVVKTKVDTLKRKYPKKYTFKIYKSEIPAGTKFFEGQDEDLCSKSLKIIEECFD